MPYRNEIKEIKNIIEEIILLYDTNIETLDLNQLFEYIFFLDLIKLINDYLENYEEYY